MRRKTFDALATSIGLVLAVILLAAGGRCCGATRS